MDRTTPLTYWVCEFKCAIFVLNLDLRKAESAIGRPYDYTSSPFLIEGSYLQV